MLSSHWIPFSWQLPSPRLVTKALSAIEALGPSAFSWLFIFVLVSYLHGDDGGWRSDGRHGAILYMWYVDVKHA